MPQEKICWSSLYLIFPLPLACAAFCVSSKARLDLEQRFGLSCEALWKMKHCFASDWTESHSLNTYSSGRTSFKLCCLNGIMFFKEKSQEVVLPSVGVIQDLLVLRISHPQRRKWKQEEAFLVGLWWENIILSVSLKLCLEVSLKCTGQEGRIRNITFFLAHPKFP